MPVFENFPFVSPIARRMRPPSVGRVEAPFIQRKNKIGTPGASVKKMSPKKRLGNFQQLSLPRACPRRWPGSASAAGPVMVAVVRLSFADQRREKPTMERPANRLKVHRPGGLEGTIRQYAAQPNVASFMARRSPPMKRSPAASRAISRNVERLIDNRPAKGSPGPSMDDDAAQAQTWGKGEASMALRDHIDRLTLFRDDDRAKGHARGDR